MRKLFIAALALVVAAALAGCGKGGGSIYSNYREIEQLELVQTLGIDRADSGAVVLTISTGSGTENVPAEMISCAGASMSSALEALQDFSPREELFYAHTQYVLIGEQAARLGIAEYLDFFERSTQMRLGMSMFVVSGGTARDLMTKCGSGDYEITKVLDSIVRDSEARGENRTYTCGETASSLAQYGAAATCSLSLGDTQDIVFAGSEGAVALSAGYAVFRDGRLAGFLTGGDARGVNALTGSLGSGTTGLSADGGEVTVEFTGCSADMTPVWDEAGGLVRLDVRLDVKAGIVELDRAQLIYGAAVTDTLSRALEETVRAWAEGALRFSIDRGADYLGIEKKLELDSDRYAAQLPKDWLERMEYTVAVTGGVERTYDIGTPADTDGEGDG